MGFIFRLSLTALIILVGFSTIVESACGGLNCTTCADDHSCFWCQDNKACYDFTALSNNTCNNYCSGSSCEDICTEPCSNGIFPCSENIVGQIMLILFYGFILSMGAKILSDGSELLLELFPKWGTVIGALLLPVLGAVPDAAIILVSGAFGSVEDAQEQVSIGVGTLAGSTIMLLTVPWFAAMHLGRCDIDDVGEAIDGRCTGFSITRQGVTVDADTPTNAKIMLGTSFAYLLVQGIAFAYLKNPESINAHKYEKPFALAGFVVCMVLLIAYCVYQIFVPKLVEKREQKLEAEREAKALRLRALHIVEKWTSSRRNHNKETAPLLGSINGSESGSTTNLNSAYIEDKGQAKALAFGLKWKRKALAMFSEEGKEENGISKFAESEAKRDDDDEEDEEDPTKHFSKNIIKAIIFLIIGTGIVAFFSDPMVDTLSDFSTKIKVKPFFVSFIVTPYCSNASELISSLIFAMKKKKENASLVYSQLYGAATMNNTLCLGLFFGLVAFRGLAWSFTAETLTILLITWIIGLIGASRTTFPYWMGIPVIALYPFSLFFVWFLESIAHWT